MRRTPAWTIAVALLLAGPVLARPYALDDLLRLEDFGKRAVDPTGRWFIFDQQAPYDSAPRFDYDGRTEVILGRPMVVDLAHPGPARPLLRLEADTGYTLGPISPSGRAILIYRHRGDLWEAGVVDLASGRERWLGLVGDISDYGRAAQWRSDTDLVLMAVANGTLPFDVRQGRRATTRLPALWDRAVRNTGVTAITLGSGRYRDANPQPPAKRLVEVDLNSSAVRTLAEAPFTDFELSRDGRFLAALAWAEPEKAVTDAVVRLGDPDRRRDLVLIDLTNGAVRHPMPGQDILWCLLSWSPTSDSLLVFSRALDAAWSTGVFSRVDARSGVVSHLRNPAIRPDLDWTPMNNLPVVGGAWLGDTPIVLGRTASAPADASPNWYRLIASGPVNLTHGEAGSALVLDPEGGVDMLAHGRAWRFDADGGRRPFGEGKAMRLGTNPVLGLGLRGTLNPPRPSSTPWIIADTSEGPCLQGAGRGVRRLCLGPDPRLDSVVAVAPAGVIRDRVDAQGINRLSLEAGDASLVFASVNTFLAGVDVARPIRIDERDPDGGARKIWLYLPPTYRPGQRLGLVIALYPGAVEEHEPYAGRPDAQDFSSQVQLIAAHGYAVLVPSLPRTPGSHDPSEGFTDRLLADVDRLAALGYVDPARVALWGHSFGGYGALVAASRTRRFAAVIAANGPTDLISDRGVFAPNFRVNPEDGFILRLFSGWAESGQGDLATTPWQDPELYIHSSPLFAANRIETPVLLFGGDLDVVGIGQQEEMFSALWRENKDAELVTFFGEGHVLASPSNIRAMYAKAFTFLDPLIGRPQP